jgi:cytoskeleton protein RodZ
MQESGDQPVSDAVPREQSPSLGTQLRKAREAKDLGLDKIADELRIDARVLQALEEDRLDDIGVAPVFVKGYIKQYGRQLGLSYPDLHAAYVTQIGNDEIDLAPSQAIQLRDERQITIWIIAALVLLLVGVFLFVWWVGDDAASPRGASAPSASSVETRPAERRLGAPAVPARDAPAAAISDPSTTDVAPGDDAAVAPADTDPTTPAPSAVAPAGQPAAGVNTGVAPAPLAVSRSASVGVVAEAGAVAITLRFREESWVEITARDDRRVFYDLGNAGAEITLSAALPVRVLLGNAPGVDIMVDDMAFPIPQRGRRGNVANFVIPAAAD